MAASTFDYVFFSKTDGVNVRELFLTHSPVPLVSICVIYFFLVQYIGPKFMEKRKPFNIERIIQIYNFLQVLICVYLIKEFFAGGFTFSHYYSCNKEAVIYPEKIVRASYISFILKLVELLETIFFVLRKKQNQVSPLHVYHHITTFTLGYIFNKHFSGTGMINFPIVMNHCVHVAMYTYYFLASFGPGVSRHLTLLKKSITQFQLIQFYLILVHAVFFFRSECSEAGSIFYYLFITDVIILILLFQSFYSKSYKKKIGNNVNK